ncbi:acyltransferase [Thalassomonas haliotis]|uniref:Acyltransferase n=1 Tax=Thalassomonas haliotis TaxID=485448 RepID=A0ABY7V925_9GAMM|nr:acyltransferase [Thalassomonas haliotis]WDE10061.1 acyltransferase [Thalassomonas haliotis]
MLSALPGLVIFPLAFILFCLNLSFCGSLVFLGGLLKLLLPFSRARKVLYRPMHMIYRLWAWGNFAIMTLFNNINWHIRGDENLSKQSWYLLIANHQSWLDIMVLANFARSRIPEPKFFLKEDLRKVPFLGMACWALDMPFMKRYSKRFIEKNPHLKGKDIETTKHSCRHFRQQPTTIINFVEGTRCNPEKQQAQKSHFKHLLPPKAGGIAFTLATLGSQFDKVLNITLIYPDNSGHVMMDMLTGKLKEVIIDIEQLPVSEQIIGDYFEDTGFKTRFQQWLNDRWQAKDELIEKLSR